MARRTTILGYAVTGRIFAAMRQHRAAGGCETISDTRNGQPRFRHEPAPSTSRFVRGTQRRAHGRLGGPQQVKTATGDRRPDRDRERDIRPGSGGTLAEILARLAAALVCAGVLAGCSGPRDERGAQYLTGDGRVGACARQFAWLDESVGARGVADAQSQRVPGFPYLRIDRLLGSYDAAAMDDDVFESWVRALSELDRRARSFELRNLSPATAVEAIEAESNDCRAVLLEHDLRKPERRRRLIRQAVARDAYDSAFRVVGLYPLSAIPVQMCIARMHADTLTRFRVPLAQTPVEGELIRFGPGDVVESLDESEVAAFLDAANDPLWQPETSDPRLARLFRTFAPVFEVDVVSDDDRIGTPGIRNGQVRVDTSRPVVFTLTSHARLESELLLQLNYVIWFPARPLSGRLDLLGGHLDGLTWRVTLGRDGRPLFYDTMHNCGCFYMAFPTDAFEPRPRHAFEEPVLAPQRLWRDARRPVIRLAARTHYVERVYPYSATSVPTAATYDSRPYDRLRSLPDGVGHRSMFGADGIVKGTERAERWLLWPMGVPKPGAMRQWGSHAIAFVGRRHFDDPDLIERNFRRTAAGRESGGDFLPPSDN